MARIRMERAGGRFLEIALTISQRVTIITRRGGHEAYAVEAAIVGIAEAFHLPVLAAHSFERSGKYRAGEGVATSGADTVAVISTKS